MGDTRYFSENLAPSGVRNRTAGSDISKVPRSNHCAISLLKTLKSPDTANGAIVHEKMIPQRYFDRYYRYYG